MLFHRNSRPNHFVAFTIRRGQMANAPHLTPPPKNDATASAGIERIRSAAITSSCPAVCATEYDCIAKPKRTRKL